MGSFQALLFRAWKLPIPLGHHASRSNSLCYRNLKSDRPCVIVKACNAALSVVFC